MPSNESRIGKVKITNLNFNADGPEYSDGDDENVLLELFKNGLSSEQRDEILSNDPSWAIRYHLAHERGNLINWYKFKEGSKVLEVGSGCGAITEALVQNEKITIVANELSERRATVNAYRNKGVGNLEIVIGNLQDYKPDVKFDYVVCVGVLEYAGTFIKDREPYKKFLELLKNFLKPNGKVLIAIENRLGHKYFAGAREDHTGGYFDGINNYPQAKAVKTFGKEEIKNLLLQCGFLANQFYYPHPDYKIPKVVYSDDFLPGVHTTIPKNIFPAPNYDQARQFLFSEQFFVDALEENKLYSNFANSFLIEAGLHNNIESPEESVVFGLTRANRVKKYKIRTTATKRNERLYFRKQALEKASVNHINNMVKTYEELNQKSKQIIGFNISKPIFHDKERGIVDFEYVEGESAESLLLKAITNDDLDFAREIIDKYRQILTSLSESTVNKNATNNQNKIFSNKLLKSFDTSLMIKSGILDFNLDNFIVNKPTNEWHLIDYEWKMNVPIPTEFIFYRGLQALFTRYKGMIESRCIKQNIIANNFMAIPSDLIKTCKLSKAKFIDTYEIENSFLQAWIFNKKIEIEKSSKFSPVTHPETYFVQFAEKTLSEQDQSIQLLVRDREQLLHDINQLKNHIRAIESSKAFRVVNKAAKAKYRFIKVISNSHKRGV